MIPLRLTLKGIYSYREEQTIDFEKLTQSALFGIFGSVGSGKSTILEAMSFAIYGETERLGQRDSRYYNMMNLKSNELLIDFRCKAGKNNLETYRFAVKGKRNSKKFEDVKLERKWYKEENGSWAVCEESPEDIIGLSYDNFRRTIIIPQGKFAEFLQMTGTERTRMLKELFQLEKYELGHRVKTLLGRNYTEKETTGALLAQLTEASQELLTHKEERLRGLDGREKEILKEYTAAQAEEQRWKEIKLRLEKLERQQQAVNEIEKHEADYLERQKQLDRYRQCRLLFGGPIEQLKQLKAELSRQETELNQLKQQEGKLSEQHQKAEADFAVIKKQFEERDSLRVRAFELRKLAELREAAASLQQLRTKLDAAEVFFRQNEEQSTNTRALLEEKLKAVQDIEAHMPDAAMISEALRWFEKKKGLKHNLDQLQKELAKAADGMQAIAQQKTTLIKARLQKHWIPAHAEPELQEAGELIRQRREAIRQEKKTLDESQRSLAASQALRIYAQNLQKGDPCPLCGATEHPGIDHNAPDEALSALEAKLQQLEIENSELEEAVLAVNSLLQQSEQFQHRQQEIAEKKIQAEQELARHQETWVFDAFDPENAAVAEAAMKQYQELSKKVQTLKTEAKVLQNDLNGYTSKREKARQKEAEIRTEAGRLEGVKEAAQNSIKNLKPEDWEEVATAEIQSQAEAAENRYQSVETEYRKAESDISSLAGGLATTRGKLEQGRMHHAQMQLQWEQTEQGIAGRLAQSEFKNREEVEACLAVALREEEEEKILRDYFNRLHTARELLKNCREETAGKSYSEESHSLCQDLLASLQQQLNSLKEEAGSLKSEIARMKEQLGEKQALEAKLEQLEKREKNLNELNKLFRESGFVNYVSSVFLQGLCHSANERFRKLTRQSLRLELTQDNQFQVRDFLNEGKLRHIKTLSGGQTFQAALSLALALADNVQRTAQNHQNFFFLDEGFGSLDKESLQVVFETLQSLRSENRVVGVISHVEELQQEIAVNLKIRLDEEKGSVVRASWE